MQNPRSVVTECAEIDHPAFQQNRLEQRNTNLFFKHLKNLNKNCNLPHVLIKDGVSSRDKVEKINMLNHYFLLVFTPEEFFQNKDIAPQKSLLTEFSILKTNLRKNLESSLIIEKCDDQTDSNNFFSKRRLLLWRKLSIKVSRTKSVCEKSRSL